MIFTWQIRDKKEIHRCEQAGENLLDERDFEAKEFEQHCSSEIKSHTRTIQYLWGFNKNTKKKCFFKKWIYLNGTFSIEIFTMWSISVENIIK